MSVYYNKWRSGLMGFNVFSSLLTQITISISKKHVPAFFLHKWELVLFSWVEDLCPIIFLNTYIQSAYVAIVWYPFQFMATSSFMYLRSLGKDVIYNTHLKADICVLGNRGWDFQKHLNYQIYNHIHTQTQIHREQNSSCQTMWLVLAVYLTMLLNWSVPLLCGVLESGVTSPAKFGLWSYVDS